MPRIKLVLAYVGTRYHGWQTQARKTGPPLVTIQSLLEEQVGRIAGLPVHVHGAGRTDSGVHADAQTAHMDVPERAAKVDWQLALNTSLPPDIRVVEVTPAAGTFHAQFDAVRKIYAYRLWLSRRYTPPRLHPFVWSCGPLDVERMDAVIPHLVGTRDFASLKNRGDLRTSVRTLHAIGRTPDGEIPLLKLEDIGANVPPLRLRGGNVELIWRFEADGFLKQMVRNTMGLLVAVGRGKVPVDAVPGILAEGDRRHGGSTAPACGLTLERVVYAQEKNIQNGTENVSPVPL